MEKQCKKGDICFITSRDSRYDVRRESIIKSSGKKWITVEGFPFDKFNAETLRPETGSLDLFIGSQLEYEKHLVEIAYKEEYMEAVSKLLRTLSSDRLKEVHLFIESFGK